MDPPDFFLKHATKLKDTVMTINSISPEDFFLKGLFVKQLPYPFYAYPLSG